jgi:hypothetical protein
MGRGIHRGVEPASLSGQAAALLNLIRVLRSLRLLLLNRAFIVVRFWIHHIQLRLHCFADWAKLPGTNDGWDFGKLHRSPPLEYHEF